MASRGTCLHKAVLNLTTIICYINIFISNYIIFLNNKHDGKALASSMCICELLNCVHALFSMTSTVWSNQLVLWIMESSKVNKICYCLIRSQQGIPSTLHKVHGVQVYI